jgi:hypothetical protein
VKKRPECGFTSETLYLPASSKSLRLKYTKFVILHAALYGRKTWSLSVREERNIREQGFVENV